MSSRALNVSSGALRKGFTVKTGETVTKGCRVKLTAEGEIDQCGANEAGIGTAEEGGVSGQKNVTVILDGHAIIPVLVGTGGATVNSYAKPVANGYADITVADGTTPTFYSGQFMQTGVAGDMVGMMIGIPTPASNA
jgi:hypothetical protein